MRTYFIIAALMGVFAFGSISLLAHAQESTSTNRVVTPMEERDAAQHQAMEGDATATVEEPEDGSGPSPAEAAKDIKACREEAYGRRSSAQQVDKRTKPERDADYQNCMSNLGYTQDEIDSSATQ